MVEAAMNVQLSLECRPVVVFGFLVDDLHRIESFGAGGLHAEDMGGASSAKLPKHHDVLHILSDTESEKGVSLKPSIPTQTICYQLTTLSPPSIPPRSNIYFGKKKSRSSSRCIYANIIVMSLRVRLLSAQLSHDTELLSNMDPYCFLQLGSTRYRSKTRKNAGKKPVWNQDFQFTANDDLLRISVYDQDTFSDDLVGEGTINVGLFKNRSNEMQQVVQLYYKGRAAGKVFLTFGGQAGQRQNVWGANNAWEQNIYNQGYNQGYNQPNYNQNYNQPNYNQPTYNQPYGQPNHYGNQAMWGSQNNVPTNSPWGDLNQNNGWGNFNPSNPNGSYSSPNIPPNNPNVNPMTLIGGIFNQSNQPPPRAQGYGNPYSGNPYQ